MGFSVIMKRDPGNRHFEAPRVGISDGEIFKINSTFTVGKDRSHWKGYFAGKDQWKMYER